MPKGKTYKSRSKATACTLIRIRQPNIEPLLRIELKYRAEKYKAMIGQRIDELYQNDSVACIEAGEGKLESFLREDLIKPIIGDFTEFRKIRKKLEYDKITQEYGNPLLQLRGWEGAYTKLRKKGKK